jgi:hypothetical protein
MLIRAVIITTLLTSAFVGVVLALREPEPEIAVEMRR